MNTGNLAKYKPSDPKDYQTIHYLLIVIVAGIFGCVLFFSGFCGEVDNARPVVNLGSFDYEKCGPPSQDRDNLLIPGMKIVFMVIDAWRYDFLASPSSPMTFIRENIKTGRAVIYKGTVQPPTVTMPRIKAMTSGIIPSFSQAVYNFFSSESTVDSWVQKAYENKKKVIFFGDDTWVNLFPSFFYRHQGVPSFNVLDYTEVDNNVTINMRRELQSVDWDVMVLHYLGLDHIGHSLGTKSGNIQLKLQEMDRVVSEIYTNLSTKGPLALVVIGDHGMNEGGSHGGASQEETEVPIVIFHNKVEIKQGLELGKDQVDKVNQVDIATTMSELMKLPLPECSRGISLIHRMQKFWYLQYKTVLHSSIQLALQLSRFATHNSQIGKFLNADFSEQSHTVCSIADDLILVPSNGKKSWSEEIQTNIISSSDEKWEFSSYFGLSIAISISLSMFGNELINAKKIGFQNILLYNLCEWGLLLFSTISCFASSLVEEEHDIWNYFTSGMLIMHAYHLIQQVLFSAQLKSWKIKTKDTVENLEDSQIKKTIYIATQTVILLCCHRYAYSLGSVTRRRWIMNPDLLPPAYYSDPMWLNNILSSASFFEPSYLFKNIFPGSASIVTTMYFTINSTKYLEKMYQGNVHLQPIYCFTLLMLLRSLAVCSGFSEHIIPIVIPLTLISLCVISLYSPTIGIILYLLYLVKPQHYLLLILVFEMGIRAKAIRVKKYLFCVMLYSSFFYSGMSNKLESIDVSAGYFGVSEYHPVTVGFQIFMNMCAPPIIFTLAYILYQSPKYNVIADLAKERFVAKVEWNSIHEAFFEIVHFRILLAGISMLAMLCFTGHLFVWSVFAPKALFEVTHCVVVLVVAFVFTFYALCIKFYNYKKERVV